MEFFRIINIETTKDLIQQHINFDNLEELCDSMFIMNYSNNRAIIGGIWGEFSLQRDKINGGLRFSFLQCPNALTYTITTGHPPEPNKIVFHLTVNRTELNVVFLEEIESFIEDWNTGIENNFKGKSDS